MDVAIVGGCGRVGLPLGLAFADAGRKVVLFDTDADSVAEVRDGHMPFAERGAPAVLDAALAAGTLRASTDPSVIREAEHVIIVIGTDLDEHLEPNTASILAVIDAIADHLIGGQLLILRSTVYPGATRLVEERIEGLGRGIDVAFCPERIAEGDALAELRDLPAIVAGRTEAMTDRADALFRVIAHETVRLGPEEAELAKLFSNAWRYISFATANQLYMIANDLGVDYERVRTALTHRYPRAEGLPSAGFAAGPCLFKDTAQLAAFNDDNFILGRASMAINEELPDYIVRKALDRFDLAALRVGILGMAFKAESDDIRASLSYRLKHVLEERSAVVLCTDPFVTGDGSLLPLEDVLEQADLLIVGAPHARYADLQPSVPVLDIWGLMGGGVRV